jgi:predicted NBD/HSP70 family sugar kinase
VTIHPVPTGQRSETVRRANLSAVVRELHIAGPRSRSDLVARTGLTRSAIRSLVGELAASGLVSEVTAPAQGVPGRPSQLVCPDPDGAVVLALEVSVGSIAAAMIGFGGEILAAVRVDRPRGDSAADEVVAALVELVGTLRRARPINDPLIGVGVAVAGVVRRSDGVVSMAPNLGWRGVPLGESLARGLDTSAPISVGNEADLGALAELRRGAAIGESDVLFISGEVGVGGGLIVGREPLIGSAGYGGEVGHMPVNPEGSACRCGATGCWETEVGEEALLRLAGHPPDGGREEVEAVLREAADGSAIALAALDRVGRWLGLGLAGLVNVFNPRLIVLGGRFARIDPFIRRALEDELAQRALPASRALVRVVPAGLGIDAPLRGAAELAFDPLLADPASTIADRDRSVERASA